MKIIEKFLTKNPCYTCGRTITPKGLMLHSVGCPQPSAMVFINQWNPPANGREVCVHGFIDGNTGDVYQTLPWNRRGWHAGGSANNTHIGFEICEPAGLVYNEAHDAIIEIDVDGTREYFENAYDNAVKLCVLLCRQFGLTEKDIVCHCEAHELGIASNHQDVMHWWKFYDKDMDDFRKEVKKCLEKYQVTESAAKTTTTATAKENEKN